MTDAIEHAIEHMQFGRWSNAREILEGVVRANPADARAMRLLGTVRYCTGELDEAAVALESSLRLDPQAADSHLNLASVYLSLGRKTEALGAARKALALDPESVDAHFNLGVATQANGRPREAEQHYEQALALDEQCLDAHMNLAALLLDRGEAETSMEHTAKVLAVNDTLHRAHLCKSRAHVELGQMEEAGKHLAAARRLRPDDPDVTTEYAGYLVACGRVAEAIECYRGVVAADPDAVEAWEGLGRALSELGRHHEVVELLSRAVQRHPGAASVATVLGQAFVEVGDEERGQELLARAAELEPDSFHTHYAHGLILSRRGLLPEADAAFERATSIAPLMAVAHVSRVQLRMAQGRYSDALGLCEQYLAVHPAERSLTAAKALVLNELGDREAAQNLVDLDRYIVQVRVEAPPAFDDLEHFNRALLDHVKSHPSLMESPRKHATRNGGHTGNLLVPPKGPFEHFEKILWDGVHRYLAAQEDQGEHVYFRHRPSFDRIVCWGVLMRRQGHQTPHIHPAAWLSGVYYAALPKVVDREGSVEGWIEFGGPPEKFQLTCDVPVRLTKPEVGLLAIFPSYFYHRTIPYHSDEERLSIAFDVLPKTVRVGGA